MNEAQKTKGKAESAFPKINVSEGVEEIRQRVGEAADEVMQYGENLLHDAGRVANKNVKTAKKVLKQHSTEAVGISFVVGLVLGAWLFRSRD